MKQLARLTLVGILGLAAALPARAGEVKLSFSGGLVTIVATDASPRQIMAEWAKLGQVRITNLERLAGGPVTIQLTDVPENQALETLLRGTAGFVAAPRQAAGEVTVSRYDRILLMPGSAPAVSSPAPTALPQPGMRGRTAPQPAPTIELPDDEEDDPRPTPLPNAGQRGGQRFPGGVSTPGQAPGYFSPYQATPTPGSTMQRPGSQVQPTPQPTASPIRSFPSPQLPPNSTSSSVPGVTTTPITIPTTPYSNAGPPPAMQQPDDSISLNPGTTRPGDTTAPAQPQYRNPYGIPETIRPPVTDPYANPYGLPNTARTPAAAPPATTPGASTPGATTPGTTTGPIKQPETKG